MLSNYRYFNMYRPSISFQSMKIINFSRVGIPKTALKKRFNDLQKYNENNNK